MNLGKKIFYCIFLIISSFNLVNAEYLIIKKSPNNKTLPITNQDPNKNQIYDTLLTYQWPSCIAAIPTLPKTEQEELKTTLFAPEPKAEENFIRSKIKKIDQTYDIVFVPDVIYELFCLSSYVYDQIEDLMTGFNLTTELSKQLSEILTNPDKTKQDFLSVYANFNKNPKAQEAFFIVNEKLANYLISQRSPKEQKNKLSIETQTKNLIKDLAEKIKEIKQKNEYLKFGKFKLLEENTISFFYQVITLEYQARKQNKAILYRGANLFESIVLPKKKQSPEEEQKSKIFDLPLTVKRFADIKEWYKRKSPQDTKPLRSISYGNSLFAGIVKDYEACAYKFSEVSNFSYALFINKTDYIFGNTSKYFFISPLKTLLGFFAKGEFFHSRTRTQGFESAKQTPKKVEGIFGEGLIDKQEIFYSRGDPLLSCSKLVEYLNKENVKILKLSEEFEQPSEIKGIEMLSNQKRAGNLYLMLYTFEKWRQLTPSLSDWTNRCLESYVEYAGADRNWDKVADDWVNFFKTKETRKQKALINPLTFIKQARLFIETLKKPWNNKSNWLNEQSGKPFIQKLIVQPDSKLCFIGDLHGSIHSLLRNLKRLLILTYINDKTWKLKDNFYLIFTGDYTNLGHYGIEVLQTLLRLKIKNENQVFLLAGNHEDVSVATNFGFKKELEVKYGPSPAQKILENLRELYSYMPYAIFIGCNNNFIQCCHGGIEIDYDPMPFLNSNKIFQKIARTEMDGFRQSYFDQSTKENPNSAIIQRPEQPDGYLASTVATEKYLTEKTKNKVKAFFRAHQHSYYGLKMLPLASVTPVEVRKKLHEREGLPWWQDVFLKYPTPITNEGLRISMYGPVFTFSSAPEGVSYLPDNTFDFDCMAILTVKQNFNDWRLIPYENPLPKDRDSRKVVIKQKEDWDPEKQLFEYDQTNKENPKIIINDCIDIEYKEPENKAGPEKTSLLKAIKENKSIEEIKELIEKDPELVNEEDHNKNTPLHSAMEKEDLELIKLLRKNGAKVNAYNEWEETPISILLKQEPFNKEILDYLIEQKNSELLDTASEMGKTNIILYLVKTKGVDINSTNSEGWAAIHAAMGENNFELAKLLMKLGTDPKIKGRTGGSLLNQSLYEYGKLHEFTKYLIEKKLADINEQSGMNGNTPLHETVENYTDSSDLDIIRFLIQNGAYKTIKNDNDETPLDIAKETRFDYNPNPELIKLLEE